MNEKQCSQCRKNKNIGMFYTKNDRSSDIDSACIECRSKSYFKKKYKTKCCKCLNYKKLNINETCSTCNKLDNKKECRKCNKLLKLEDFYVTKSRCKNCCR